METTPNYRISSIFLFNTDFLMRVLKILSTEKNLLLCSRIQYLVFLKSGPINVSLCLYLKY